MFGGDVLIMSFLNGTVLKFMVNMVLMQLQLNNDNTQLGWLP